MNKSELVEAVSSDAGVSKAEAEGVLTSFFETVKSKAKGGDAISWPGFGKFSTTDRPARTGRNPQTGASVKIKASKGMKFTPSSVLKEFLNTKGAAKAPAKKDGAGKATASKASASKASASKTSSSTSSAKKAPAKKAAAKKAPAKKSAAKKAPAKKAPAKRK